MHAAGPYGGYVQSKSATQSPALEHSVMREAAQLRGGATSPASVQAILSRGALHTISPAQQVGSGAASRSPPAAPAGTVGSSAVWAFPRGASAGYRNLGNTCFLASVLQLLGHTPALAALAHKQTHTGQCRLGPGQCAVCALETRIRATLQAGPHAPQTPEDVLRWMQGSASLQPLTRGRQEDAHECLRLLLETLHHSGLRGMNCPVYGPGAAPGPHRSRTLVETVFGGRLLSRVTCCSCGGHSDTLDSFEDLSLELTPGTDTVHAALAGFTREERLNGADRYKCDRCNSLSDATKRISVAHAPSVLVLHLKRFKSNGWGKNCAHVAFSQHLDLEPFSTAPAPPAPLAAADQAAAPDAAAAGMQHTPTQQRPVRYNLYGVIVHSGYGMHSGHYYAYVRDGMGRWYCCDDSIVRAVQEAEVLRCEAYILAYVREPSTQALARKSPAPAVTLTQGAEEMAASALPDARAPATSGNGPPANAAEAATNAPPSPPQVPRPSGVPWSVLRVRLTAGGGHGDPEVAALGAHCVAHLQAARTWTSHVTDTLRSTAAAFHKQHGRPASVDELLRAWEQDNHNGKRKAYEVLMSTSLPKTMMEEWCATGEQLLRKHARLGENDHDQSPPTRLD